MSTSNDREGRKQADLFGICLTGVDQPENATTERPAPRRDEARPQPGTRPTR